MFISLFLGYEPEGRYSNKKKTTKYSKKRWSHRKVSSKALCSTVQGKKTQYRWLNSNLIVINCSDNNSFSQHAQPDDKTCPDNLASTANNQLSSQHEELLCVAALSVGTTTFIQQRLNDIQLLVILFKMLSQKYPIESPQ